jgi:hypothetical protein
MGIKMFNYIKLLRTIGHFLGIGYGIVFVSAVIAVFMEINVESIPNLDLSFILWAIGVGLVRATN